MPRKIAEEAEKDNIVYEDTPKVDLEHLVPNCNGEFYQEEVGVHCPACGAWHFKKEGE